MAKPASAAPPQFTFRTEISDAGKFTHHYAKALSGLKQDYYLGYEAKYLSNLGLAQSVKRLAPVGAQKYDPADYSAEGYWANLIVPTATGESALWFERINTYDRAAFTFGFFQAAAHYPGDNFILLFKDMLARPEGATWFPDLKLKPQGSGTRLYQVTATGDLDLEHEEMAGSEPNLKRFMAYLNPTLAKVEPGELSVAARMMQWTREVPECRKLQVKHAIVGLKSRMKLFKTELAGRAVDQCLLAADVRYQGRGLQSEIRAALKTEKPYDALLKLGADKHGPRIATVDKAIQALMKDAVISKLRFDSTSATLFK